MTRDTRRGLLIAAASGLAAGALIVAGRANGAPPRHHAPDVPAAAERAGTHGWPHTPTVREARQVARYTHRQVTHGGPGARSLTYCRALRADTAGAWTCRTTITFTHNELTGARLPSPRTYRFRTWTQVWEDGSARVIYPGR